jgi:hypothetical protein
MLISSSRRVLPTAAHSRVLFPTSQELLQYFTAAALPKGIMIGMVVISNLIDSRSVQNMEAFCPALWARKTYHFLPQICLPIIRQGSVDHQDRPKRYSDPNLLSHSQCHRFPTLILSLVIRSLVQLPPIHSIPAGAGNVTSYVPSPFYGGRAGDHDWGSPYGSCSFL